MRDVVFFFFFKQKTAYEMRSSDWSSDVCSSDLVLSLQFAAGRGHAGAQWMLGRMYAEGDGVAHNDEKAFYYFREVVREASASNFLDSYDQQIGRASCRERVCQFG